MQTDLVSAPSWAPFRHRHDRRLGLLIILGSFLIALVFSFWARERAQPEVSEPPKPPTTVGLKGWPQKVDVVAALAQARELTRRNILRGFVADGVASSGAINVESGTASVRYSFQSPAGHGPQPRREPGTAPRHFYCGRQFVSIQKQGMQASPDNDQAACFADTSAGLPDPKCTLSQIWALARLKGAPVDRTARVEYYRAVRGPAWRFSMLNTPYRFSVDGDCQTELSEALSFGSVP